jgi:hypothetical protein
MVRIVLECDSAEQERYDTAHAETVGEEVGRIRNERNDTALNLGVRRKMRVLEGERARQTKSDTQQHGPEEREQEDADTVEQTRDVNILAVEVGQGPKRSAMTGEAQRLLTRT